MKKKKKSSLKAKIKNFKKENNELNDKMEKTIRENQELKDIIQKLKSEAGNVESKSQNNDDRKTIKTIITIIDELEGLKLFAEKSGNEKLEATINKNFKFINREIARIGLRSESYIGQKFNENYHECVDEVEDSEKEYDTIVEEIKKCYFHNDEVIRAAQVITVVN